MLVLLVEFVLSPAIVVTFTFLATFTAVEISRFTTLLVQVQTIRAAHSLCRLRQQDRSKRNKKYSCEDETQTTCHHMDASFCSP
jgi:hypothetical protein